MIDCCSSTSCGTWVSLDYADKSLVVQQYSSEELSWVFNTCSGTFRNIWQTPQLWCQDLISWSSSALLQHVEHRTLGNRKQVCPGLTWTVGVATVPSLGGSSRRWSVWSAGRRSDSPPADGGCHDEGFGPAPAALLCPFAPSAGQAEADEDPPPAQRLHLRGRWWCHCPAGHHSLMSLHESEVADGSHRDDDEHTPSTVEVVSTPWLQSRCEDLWGRSFCPASWLAGYQPALKF